MKRYVLALDQGTTSCRAIVFDRSGRVLRIAQREFSQYFPQAGWVEHDAEEIWRVQLQVMREAAEGLDAAEIAAVGITNQRETTVVWDKATGKPLHRAIVWQCRRTSELCEQLKRDGWDHTIRMKTGLVTDPYFSATKLHWILEHVPGVREKAEAGEAMFGTIDTWLIWNLTAGRVHATDVSNASRTMMFNIDSLEWDPDILQKLNIPAAMLPEVKPSSHIYGETELLGGAAAIPVASAAGDQQAALFGQCCYEPGMAKNTYGTGCFMLKNTGETRVTSLNGLLTTIAWGLNGKTYYALEGSVFTAGAVVQWLRDGLQIISDASETEALAESVEDTAGVYVVPAFTGLGTPYWTADARGMITGLTRGSGKAHIVRASLESIAYQTVDVLRVMEKDSGIRLHELRVDGGATKNRFLMQFQADMLGVRVTRPKVQETTALGAAYLAGLAVGFWSGADELKSLWERDCRFDPAMDSATRSGKYAGWQRAVGYQL
ncbi:MAG: glycerol kinase [Paenibacillus sp.]|nr:glycerol kinase [Paenibacillus sp.]